VNLVPIGRFSEMTCLSETALRLYDENGLLLPAHVDPSSGYRYYASGIDYVPPNANTMTFATVFTPEST